MGIVCICSKHLMEDHEFDYFNEAHSITALDYSYREYFHFYKSKNATASLEIYSDYWTKVPGEGQIVTRTKLLTCRQIEPCSDL